LHDSLYIFKFTIWGRTALWICQWIHLSDTEGTIVLFLCINKLLYKLDIIYNVTISKYLRHFKILHVKFEFLYIDISMYFYDNMYFFYNVSSYFSIVKHNIHILLYLYLLLNLKSSDELNSQRKALRYWLALTLTYF